MALPPSLYGTGPFGVGVYSAYTGVPVAIAAATQIRFAVQARGIATLRAMAGRTQISFSLQGEIVKTWQDGGPCFVPCQTGTWKQVFPPWVVRMAA